MTDLDVPGPGFGKLRLPPTTGKTARHAYWLLVICANLGRGYKPGEFMDNVATIVAKLKGLRHFALLLQEMDEDDPAPEHKQFMAALRKALDGEECPAAGWRTHEPIVLSPTLKMRRERVAVTMGSGLQIGAPEGTGPVRNAVSCVAKHHDKDGLGLRVGLATTHPHRNLPIQVVQKARRHGEAVMRQELTDLYEAGGGTSVIYGEDPNDKTPVPMLVGERTAIQRGGTGDFIRYKEHPEGAELELMGAGSLKGTIDPHDPLWALFKVAARAA